LVDKRLSFGFLTPEDGPICCPEMSVRNYHHLLRNNPEEQFSSRYLFRNLDGVYYTFGSSPIV
jgi:hypothetical protein